KAIDKTIGLHFLLEDFYITAVTGGRDAQGTAKVRLRYGDKDVTAVGISTDIIEASILAYLNAANELLTEIETEL
ncbi:MAG: 2-isopropylmalate synthase, partial [Clostridia bacterium]|nr:2-isopropylmalate synthase [Clostridia bacterium]